MLFKFCNFIEHCKSYINFKILNILKPSNLVPRFAPLFVDLECSYLAQKFQMDWLDWSDVPNKGVYSLRGLAFKHNSTTFKSLPYQARAYFALEVLLMPLLILRTLQTIKRLKPTPQTIVMPTLASVFKPTCSSLRFAAPPAVSYRRPVGVVDSPPSASGSASCCCPQTY